MHLTSLKDLQLYVDREIKQDNKAVTKRVLLEDDLIIGETAYFKNNDKNKIVKIDEDHYIFYRFDEIQTHIDNYDIDYSVNDINQKIISKFDYDLEYACDRNNFIEDLIEQNEWLYDLLSSHRVIQKEHKSKNSFLSENQNLDLHIQKIANYILHPKFNNQDTEKYYHSLKDKYKRLKDKASKTNSEIIEMFNLKDEIDLINQGVITKSGRIRNLKREELVSDFTDLEQQETIEFNLSSEKAKVDYIGKELKIDKNYWLKMGFSEKSAKFRQEIIDNYEEALSILEKQLGYNKLNKTERKKTQEEFLNRLEPIVYNNNGRKVKITPDMRFSEIKKIYSELKSDFYKAKEILAIPVSFSQIEPTFSKYNFNYDTWYENESGEIVEISKNMVLFSNPNTYKGLLLNYFDLKSKYQDQFDDDMWAILIDFENIVSKTEFSKQEKFVISLLLNDYSRKEILDMYIDKFNSSITYKTLSQWINKIIPNKLLETYLNLIDDWLYTFIIKGEFKQCSSCKEVKIINNNRYFYREPKGKDGFKNICIKCDSKKRVNFSP